MLERILQLIGVRHDEVRIVVVPPDVAAALDEDERRTLRVEFTVMEPRTRPVFFTTAEFPGGH
jgi:hypothetical protein